jgi:hypothetical protein
MASLTQAIACEIGERRASRSDAGEPADGLRHSV